MALTPEQILNKHFQTTQFRKGYDERDVDDFLDEIVAEMRTLVSQRNDIRQQLEECRAGRGQAKDGTPTATAGPAVGAPADGSATEQAHAELAQLQARITAAEAREKELSERAARAQREVESLEAAVKDRQSTLGKSVRERLDAAETNARAAVGARQAAEQRTGELEQELHDLQAQHTSLQDHRSEMAQADAQARDQDSNTGAMRVVAAGAGGAVAGGSAAALIELAQRLHDEHVGTGEAKREELISDGRRQYDELVGTAQSRHDELLSTAQSQHDELVGTAQERHDSLIAEATSRHEELITEGRERSTGMVAEAQQRKAAVLAELEHEKGMLEKKIEELRGFERTYRSQLKSYLQSQLEELDHTGVDAASEREATAPEDTGQDNG